MENIESNKYVKTCDFSCSFCNATFSLKKTLDVHLKTSKKCIASRPKIDISCIWCNSKFLTNDMLEKHYKKCEADKNTIYIKLLEESKYKDKEIKLIREEKEKLKLDKDKEIERLNNLVKELSSKIKSNVTNNTNNTVTYNITLNCAKPLLLSQERIIELMDKTCEPYYIKRGQKGLADWFLNDVCRNENSEIAIECTDKVRKRFRYEDENDLKREISGDSLIDLLEGCIPSFINSAYFNKAVDDAGVAYTEDGSTVIYDAIEDFKKPKSVFVNYLVDKTHIKSVNCILPKKK